MKDISDNNPTVDKAIHNGADVSIDTQSEEEENNASVYRTSE